MHSAGSLETVASQNEGDLMTMDPAKPDSENIRGHTRERGSTKQDSGPPQKLVDIDLASVFDLFGPVKALGIASRLFEMEPGMRDRVVPYTEHMEVVRLMQQKPWENGQLLIFLAPIGSDEHGRFLHCLARTTKGDISFPRLRVGQKVEAGYQVILGTFEEGEVSLKTVAKYETPDPEMDRKSAR